MSGLRLKMPGMLFGRWLLSLAELFWGELVGRWRSSKGRGQLSRVEAPSPRPLPDAEILARSWHALHPTQSQMVHAPLKTLSWGHKPVHNGTQSFLLCQIFLPKIGGTGPTSKIQRKILYLIFVCFYDPLKKFPLSLIKMSYFPMKNLKIIDRFYFKNSTPAENQGFQKSIQMLCWGSLPWFSIIPGSGMYAWILWKAWDEQFASKLI